MFIAFKVHVKQQNKWALDPRQMATLSALLAEVSIVKINRKENEMSQDTLPILTQSLDHTNVLKNAVTCLSTPKRSKASSGNSAGLKKGENKKSAL